MCVCAPSDAISRKDVSSTFDGQTIEENPAENHENYVRGDEEKPKSSIKLSQRDVNSDSGRSQVLHQNDETSDLYLM